MKKLSSWIVRTVWLFMLILIISNNRSLAQQQDSLKSDDGSNFEEFLEQSEDESFTDDTYFEKFDALKSNRLNINFATREELEALDLLSDVQIQNIIVYRAKYGEFKSPYELLGIETMNKAEIQRLLPFIKFVTTDDPPQTMKSLFKRGKHALFLRYIHTLEEKRGFTPPDTNSDGSLTSRYLGIEPRLYARYRFSQGTNLSIGVTLEQDPGEPFKHPKQKIGVDYLSGHFFLKNRGFLKRLAVGDFEMNIGQGLFMQQSFASRKSSYVNNVKKKYNPFRPHTSANEVRFFRGVAAEFQLAQKWSMMAYGSYRKLDANAVLESDSSAIDEEEIVSVTSLQTSGLHRTESELADKGANAMWSGGGSLTFHGNKARVSANAAYFNLATPLQRNPAPYNKFEFSGKDLLNVGLDYQVLHKNVSLFGEIAFSDNGGWGMLNGGNFNLPLDIKLTILHRYYAKNLQTLYGNAFAESSRPINEHGLYLGVTFSPFKYAEWTNYVDIYQHKWLRFGIDGPSHGIDLLSKFQYQPKRWLTFYVRGRYEQKQENAPANESAIDYLVPTKRGGLRFHFEFLAKSNLKFKSRIEFAWYNDGVNERSNGYLLYQDVSYNFKKIPLTLHARYALFQTDSYDSRIYAYENDLLYVITILPYSRTGSRYYLTAKIQAHRNIDFWIKWAQTFFPKESTISSGNEEIENNIRSEIKLQMRLKF